MLELFANLSFRHKRCSNASTVLFHSDIPSGGLTPENLFQYSMTPTHERSTKLTFTQKQAMKIHFPYERDTVMFFIRGISQK